MGVEGSRHVNIATGVGLGDRPRLVTSSSSATAIPTAGRRLVDADLVGPPPSAAGPASSPGPGRGDIGGGAVELSSGRYHHHYHRSSLSDINFPNMSHCRETETDAWTLLHQCGLERWKDGHAGRCRAVSTVQWELFDESSGACCMFLSVLLNIHVLCVTVT